MSAQLSLGPVFETWHSFEEVSGIGHINNDADYTEATKLADVLVDDGAMDAEHPHHSLFMTIADLIYAYDQRHYPMPRVLGSEMLRFLMTQHGLKQNQLPEIGKQSVVSEILSGQRNLTVDHIRGLSNRFAVSPAAFF